jgi:hypothetical protein
MHRMSLSKITSLEKNTSKIDRDCHNNYWGYENKTLLPSFQVRKQEWNGRPVFLKE